MSDEQVVAAPAAPVTPAVTTTTTEASGAPAPAPTITEGPKETAQQAIARIKSGKVSVTPSPAALTEQLIEAQPRGPDGKFQAKPAGDEPVASDAGTTTPVAGGEPAAEFVKITLPEDHPLRARGISELPFDVPKPHEEIVRSLLNEPVRKQQIAQAYEQARQAQAIAAEREAEAAFWRENMGKALTPEFYAKYADIKQTYGEADAERYRRAVMAEAQDQLTEQVGQTRAKHQTEHLAHKFRDHAMNDALRRFPGWVVTDQDGNLTPTPAMQQAFKAYGASISATGSFNPNADWLPIATALYESSPLGQQRRAAEAQRIASDATQRATEEAKKREAEALEQAAQARARNPLGAVPNVQTGLTVPGAPTGPRTAAEFKQQLAQRARGY